MTEEFKPIDITRYTITENGNVLRSKTMTKDDSKRQIKRLQEELNEWKTKFSNLQKYLDTQTCYRECAETWQKNKELQEQIEKTKWHDLRKDPNDLPREGTRVFSETGDIVLLQDRKWKEFSPPKLG